MWNITHISKNHYKINRKDNDKFIEFSISTGLKNNPEILLDNSRNMSNDHVIFIPSVYESPENNIAIIGDAYQYDGLKCIGKDLVTVHILNTNISDNDAKVYLELLCS